MRLRGKRPFRVGLLLAATIAGSASARQDDVIAAAETLVRETRPAQPPGSALRGDAFIDAGRGPVPVRIPAQYDPEHPTPLVLLLHGYSATGSSVDAWMGLSALVDEYGFLLVIPEGTSDILGNQYWNATDACCDLFGSGVDDSSYLRALIASAQAAFNVDEERIHAVGHSNGGFMAYRLACDHPDLFASIASLAGATWDDPAQCAPDGPVHVLQIHGTSDGVIQYGGGCLPGGCYPGAVDSVEQWAAFDGCAPDGVVDPAMLDLDGSISGAETTVVRYAVDCEVGGSSELWSIAGGAHSPALTSAFGTLVLEHIAAHPKTPPCGADVDGDGHVGVGDLLAVLAAWGRCPAPCPADLDGDGDVTVGDLLELLGAWGPC